MSESKHNPIAQLAAMMPSLVPPGHAVQVRWLVDVTLKHNAVRVESDEEEAEARAAYDGLRAMKPELPEPVFFRPGDRIPTECCDAVIVLATSVQDQTRNIVSPNGKAPKLPTSMVLHTEYARMPLAEWWAAHEQQLKGAR